ncbi:DUF4153 domain-containing protein [Streptomyces sp. NPDC052179]|uniref:DUF4153 domain-containing protein n=1 Tax=Streptomyces sp. NPDC052179 TaxID=3155680 RepID=UPI003424C241
MSDQPSEASNPPNASDASQASSAPETFPRAEGEGAAARDTASVLSEAPAAVKPEVLVAGGAGPLPAPADPQARQQRRRAGPHQGNPWQPGPKTPRPLSLLRPTAPAPVRAATLWAVLATALLSSLLLGDGVGPNLLIVALPAALAAFFAAQAVGRRPRPWTLTWAVGGLALLSVPALRDAGWPTFFAVVSAIALGSLALHGSRSWLGVLAGSVGLFDSIVPGLQWGWRGLRDRADGHRGRWGAALRTTAVAAMLLIVFGALFASADAAFADLLGNLTPDASVGEGPWRFFLFLLGLAGALAAAYTAAAPVRWDGLTVRPGKPRGRVEWALPLIVLNLLFAAFIALQLTVLFGGYGKVLTETGPTRSEYARQGFWQLLWATLLTLLVIALALRWAPRGGKRDRTLVRSVLGTLCVLTLVVVASALRRMDLYVDEYGLTRLRISVAAVELWLGVVMVLILGAGVFGARILPRAVAVSAAVGVLAFGLLSPDAVIAEQNVQRHRQDKPIDIAYLRGLSADAVPALNTLPEPLRSCALQEIQSTLDGSDPPWYATSWGEARARGILEKRPAVIDGRGCFDRGSGSERDANREDDSYDPY